MSRQSTVKLWFDDGSCVEVRVSAHRKLVRVDSELGDNMEVLITGPAPPLPKGAALQALLDKPLEDLGFSVRTSNCMGQYGLDLFYVGDLVTLTDRDLLRAKNFGRKSMTEVGERLAEYRLGIGMQREDLQGWLPPPPVLARQPDYESGVLDRRLDSFGMTTPFRPWIVKRLESRGIRLVGTLVQQSAVETIAFVDYDYPRFRHLRRALADLGLTLDMTTNQLFGWEAP